MGAEGCCLCWLHLFFSFRGHLVVTAMPNTCCVPGCRSGYKGTVEKVSLFCLPADAEQRERWKPAIPRQETVEFSFDSKYTRLCEKHFDASDIVRADVCTVNGNIVSLPRDRPRLVEDAVPRIVCVVCVSVFGVLCEVRCSECVRLLSG